MIKWERWGGRQYRTCRMPKAGKIEWQEEEDEASQIWETLGLLGAMEMDSCQLLEPPLYLDLPLTRPHSAVSHHLHYYNYRAHGCSRGPPYTVEKHFPDES